MSRLRTCPMYITIGNVLFLYLGLIFLQLWRVWQMHQIFCHSGIILHSAPSPLHRIRHPRPYQQIGNVLFPALAPTTHQRCPRAPRTTPLQPPACACAGHMDYVSHGEDTRQASIASSVRALGGKQAAQKAGKQRTQPCTQADNSSTRRSPAGTPCCCVSYPR